MHLRRDKLAETLQYLKPRGKLAKRAARGAIRDHIGSRKVNQIKGTATKPTKPNKPA